MPPPVSGTPAEKAAYRAGVTDARLLSLEKHQDDVNGTIKTTGEALQELALSVNDFHLTFRMLDLDKLTERISVVEDQVKVAIGIAQFKRWLLGAVVAIVIAFTAVVELVIHLSH